VPPRGEVQPRKNLVSHGPLFRLPTVWSNSRAREAHQPPRPPLLWSDSEPLPRGELQPETDLVELAEGFATLTPLHIDMTHRQLMDRFAGFEWSVE